MRRQPAVVGAEPAIVTPEVASALDRIEASPASWSYGLVMLGVSVALFVGGYAAGETPAARIGALVVVLLVHELGHVAAMRAFGFRDPQMFFIPFLGAVATGRKAHASGTEGAIVTLAGPLPGLCAALLAGAIGGARPGSFVHELIVLSVAINGVNLLPIAPFDGGRLLRIALVGRAPVAEAVVQLLSGLTLVAFSALYEDVVLAVVGALLSLGTPAVYGLARVARLVRRELSPAVEERIALELREPIAQRVAADRHLARYLRGRPGVLAGLMVRVWQRAQERPPSGGATIALLALQSSLLALSVAGWTGFAAGPRGHQTADFTIHFAEPWTVLPPEYHVQKSGLAATNYSFQRADQRATIRVEVVRVVPAMGVTPAQFADRSAATLRDQYVARGERADPIELWSDGARGFGSIEPQQLLAMYRMLRIAGEKVFILQFGLRAPAADAAAAQRAARALFEGIELH